MDSKKTKTKQNKKNAWQIPVQVNEPLAEKWQDRKSKRTRQKNKRGDKRTGKSNNGPEIPDRQTEERHQTSPASHWGWSSLTCVLCYTVLCVCVMVCCVVCVMVCCVRLVPRHGLQATTAGLSWWCGHPQRRVLVVLWACALLPSVPLQTTSSRSLRWNVCGPSSPKPGSGTSFSWGTTNTKTNLAFGQRRN